MSAVGTSEVCVVSDLCISQVVVILQGPEIQTNQMYLGFYIVFSVVTFNKLDGF